MLTLLKRHEIQVLLDAGHTQAEVARLAKVSERSVRRIAGEPAVEHVDDERERAKRRIGRPSKVARCRPLVEELLEEVDQDSAPLKSVEILRRARLDGYDGGNTALYELIAELRPRSTPVMMRFEGLPGEFSQHDFGQTIIPFSWSGRRTGMAAVQADVRPRSDTVPECRTYGSLYGGSRSHPPASMP